MFPSAQSARDLLGLVYDSGAAPVAVAVDGSSMEDVDMMEVESADLAPTKVAASPARSLDMAEPWLEVLLAHSCTKTYYY